MLLNDEVKISYVDLDFAHSKIKALAALCNDARNLLNRVYLDQHFALSRYELLGTYNLAVDSLERTKLELQKSASNLDTLLGKVFRASEKFKEYEQKVRQMLNINLGETAFQIIKIVNIFASSVFSAVAKNTKEMILEGEGFDAWSNFQYDATEKVLLAAQGSNINIKNFSSAAFLAMCAAGVAKSSVLQLIQKHTDEQIEKQTVDFNKNVPEKFKNVYKKPANLEELAYKAGSMESYTFDGTTDVQVMVKDGDPPLFTVMIPPTSEWSNVNGWPENFNIMSGNSELAQIAKTALETEMQKYGIRDFSKPNVMLAGFSLGGLASAFFAEKYSKSFNIKQIVTFGSPIAGFNVPKTTKVLAYEFENDPISQLDFKNNPNGENWETISIPRNDLNEKGIAKPKDPINVHYMTHYAPKTKEFEPKTATDFEMFLSSKPDRSDLKISNYESKLIV
ncbi:MAG: hypothetical protein LBB10_00475 [Bifidobacteriaceae bacterium]|jgi:hypothetical protein|nr:hypothetical protein [Bifidobacteriaceae bacterium]